MAFKAILQRFNEFYEKGGYEEGLELKWLLGALKGQRR